MIIVNRFVQSVERFYWYLYSHIWDQYLESPEFSQNVDNILTCLIQNKQNEHEKILDLGCGTGTYSIQLAEMGFHVVGIDFSAKMLKKAQKKSKPISNHSPSFIQMDLNKIHHFPTDEFHQVLCIHTFQNVKDPFQFLQQVKRIVKPGGLLLILVKDPWQRKQTKVELRLSMIKIVIKLLKKLLSWVKHKQQYTKEELISLLVNAGFEYVKECPFSGAMAILFRVMAEVKPGC
jgi:ubiquinone/menaquinone biosynthesis C-methylase UbiE